MKYLTAEEMVKVDEKAVDYGLSVLQMMENAGRNVANFIANLKPRPEKVIVMFGKGNNGGDGLATARHLSIKGFDVKLIAASKEFNENTKRQLSLLKKMGIIPKKDFDANKKDVILDSLLGYGIKGDLRGKYRDLIKSMNFMKDKGIRVISLDLPSGLNPNTGERGKPTVKADYILTLGLPQKGLEGMENVYLVNLGIPDIVFEDLGVKMEDYFSNGDVVKISR